MCCRELSAVSMASLLNARSGHALPSSTVLSGTAPEHISDLELVTAALWQCVPHKPSSSAAATADKCTFLCTPSLRLPKSPRVNGSTFERNKHNFESTVPTTSCEKRAWCSVCFA